ncbi:uncharacterized protein EAE97_004607 [Botrytis byssoidea]|uniref:Uncharacterized protein n=1 Tax=Botrytis byssoidea TaxID=139641 RepID=A0A9P5M105_9HELO|nr:uncharacterized protein EAE97_004607 [Botrytis byssoidea]KAF7947358.1 hypothetical protein EAE97_004607 [Botrytis byssoidea]
MRENEHLAGLSKMTNAHNQTQASTPTTSTPTHSGPMDLDAIKMREQQWEEERRLGLCHYCKKAGNSV